MNITFRQNMTNRAISQYAGLFFDRGMCSIAGKLIGLNCESLCSIEGDTDNGEIIESKIRSGFIHGKDGVKRVRSVYVKGQFETSQSVSFKYDLDNYSPDASTVKASTSVTGAGGVKFHGERSRFGEYLCYELANQNGEYFYISAIEAIMVFGVRK